MKKEGGSGVGSRPCWSSLIQIPNPYVDQQAQLNLDLIQIGIVNMGFIVTSETGF